MDKFNLYIFFIISFSLSWNLIRIFIPVFRQKWSVIPNERSSHEKSTPIGGGLIFSSISILSSILFQEFSILIFFPLVLIGHLDDCKGIAPLRRLFIQIAIALMIIFYQKNSLLLNSLNFGDLSFLIESKSESICFFTFLSNLNIFSFVIILFLIR